ncbi:hypothetical protein DRE_00415 [Drechslerella stenobrocha 248]|uniref:Uncharacterized protein n=1 Tax=Drechslerella stenobrocha 248 TaxID=1043628 RepID=W7I4R9_9PEZI|nr:hypothetical protein DRE_00415 [Drechslerella stenobrocha 248]
MSLRADVDLASVVFTNVETPVAWSAARTANPPPQIFDTIPGNPKIDISQTFIPDSQEEAAGSAPFTYTGGVMDPPGTATFVDHTATRTLSIVHNHFVIATFTVVGTSASPPRGVSPEVSIFTAGGILTFCVTVGLILFFFAHVIGIIRRQERKAARLELRSIPERDEHSNETRRPGRKGHGDDVPIIVYTKS